MIDNRAYGLNTTRTGTRINAMISNTGFITRTVWIENTLLVAIWRCAIISGQTRAWWIVVDSVTLSEWPTRIREARIRGLRDGRILNSWKIDQQIGYDLGNKRIKRSKENREFLDRLNRTYVLDCIRWMDFQYIHLCMYKLVNGYSRDNSHAGHTRSACKDLHTFGLHTLYQGSIQTIRHTRADKPERFQRNQANMNRPPLHRYFCIGCSARRD